jgi:endo-1,4-beta-xylanase
MQARTRWAVGGWLGAALLAAAGGAQAQSLREAADLRDRYIGAAVDMNPFRNEAPYRETLAREFNMLVGENAFKMDAMRPSRTTFNFNDTDALMQFAEANNMAVRGHTLVWHSQLPGWLTGGSFTRDEVIAIMREHILTVVGRYRGRIVHWDVVNEAFEDNGQLRTGSFWHQRIGPEYIAMAFQFAREADPTAVLYYNDFSAEGINAKSDGIFNLMRNLRDQGVPVHGVGWQMHQINPFRIQAQHRTNMQRLADLGLEISITEMDVRIQLPTETAELQQQALAYSDTMQLCLEQPACTAVVAWGFTDKYSWVPGFFQGFGDALIFNTTYQPKPAYTALRQALTGGTTQPPSPPTGLTATAGNGQVQLNWNASAGATSYNVKRSTTAGGPYAIVGSTSGTSFTNTGLTNGTLYFFVVSAANAAGESANSGEVSARPQPPAGFTMTVSPTSAAIAPGACVVFAVSISRPSGFTGPVTLSVTGLPAGWTVTINPNPVTGNNATITVCAPATAAPGAVSFTIVATGGGVSRTATVTLNVSGTPNFALTANPGSLSVVRGASGTSTISIARSSFTGPVAFSASGVPAGVTATFSPTSTSGNSVGLSLAASSAAALGTSTITVNGTGGGLTRTATVGLTVTADSGTGGVTLTPAVTTSSPWFNEQVVRLANTAPLTALSLTIVVQRTQGISFSGQYNTVGGQIQQANSSTTAAVTYTFNLAAGQTLSPGSNRTFAAQTSGTGTLHPTAGDTFTVTYTTGGVTYTRSGRF